MRGHTNWSNKVDGWGRSLLRQLGYDPDYLPRDHNPITRALRENPQFVAENEADLAFNRISLSKLATICQMVVFDAVGGPERDNKPKALRRHWYQWYKVHFAQPLALQYGDFEIVGGARTINDIAWTQRLSQTYAYFVDEEDVTYDDLWVEDASRMMERIDQELFRGANILVAVEKDSLFSDFRTAAKALGARAIYSGKGKSSKAAIERMLRDHFGWSEEPRYNYETHEYEEVFTANNPLVVLHVSDHDFDGEAVIGPTFGEQARRYTPHVLEARIGIVPQVVSEKGYALEDTMYSVKISHKGYVSWAEENALFLGRCTWCGKPQVVQGVHSNGHVSDCCSAPFEALRLGKGGDTAYGLEVEAMTVRDYHDLIVRALLEVLPFDYIVNRLRHHIKADPWTAAQRVRANIQAKNEDYQRLLEEFQRLEEIKNEFDRNVENILYAIAEDHQGDFWEDGDDPEPEDFEEHVVEARDYTGPWRPFSTERRTDLLVEWITENEQTLIEDLQNEAIDF